MELLTLSVVLTISILFLFIGGWAIIQGSSILARLTNINKAVIGFTIISLATSLPELFVSVKAALIKSNDFAIANVIGSNVCNISLILGLSTLIKPLYAKKIERKLLPFFIISTIILFLIIYKNQIIGFTESFLMLIILVIINFIVFFEQKDTQKKGTLSNQNIINFLNIKININNKIKAFFIIIIGGLALHFGSSLLVINSISIAALIGVEERVIAISFVAIGTSIPELTTTIIAISKKEFELIIGNILGSNIFNILAVLGVSGLITEIKIENESSMLSDALFMLSISLFIFFLFKYSSKKKIGRLVGFILLTSYISYIIFVFR
jgi:cation:H+ antiporter